MKVSDNFCKNLEEFEGCLLNAYQCPAKVWTIGIGSTFYPNGVHVKAGDRLPSKEEAYKLLRDTVGSYENTVNKLVKVELTQNQFDALVSFVYNLGATNFANSTLLKLLNQNDYEGAAEQFLRWNKAGGKVLNGLTKRREKEMELFLS